MPLRSRSSSLRTCSVSASICSPATCTHAQHQGVGGAGEVGVHMRNTGAWAGQVRCPCSGYRWGWGASTVKEACLRGGGLLGPRRSSKRGTGLSQAGRLHLGRKVQGDKVEFFFKQAGCTSGGRCRCEVGRGGVAVGAGPPHPPTLPSPPHLPPLAPGTPCLVLR